MVLYERLSSKEDVGEKGRRREKKGEVKKKEEKKKKLSHLQIILKGIRRNQTGQILVLNI